MYRKNLVAFSLSLAVLPACAQSDFSQSDFAEEREFMVEQVIQLAELTGPETGRPQFADRVIEAIRTVPRHEFVPEAFRGADAYRNSPLPIGSGQTISQPYVVALMTDLADVGPDSAVLEIGTGSGYQAAVLAEFVDRVYTIEIIEPLGRRAAQTLQRLGYSNVSVRIGDGYQGWPEFAPFDAILVTAAPEAVPEPLIMQLKPGGRLVIPVGPENEVQSENRGRADARDARSARQVCALSGRGQRTPLAAINSLPAIPDVSTKLPRQRFPNSLVRVNAIMRGGPRSAKIA